MVTPSGEVPLRLGAAASRLDAVALQPDAAASRLDAAALQLHS